MVDGIGRVLGDRYRLTAMIGSGASASVYVADDGKLGRRVAVKVLHPGLAGDLAFLHRFREEARSAARLNHPGLMAVYDTGDDDTSPYLVLELLGGGSLRALLDAGHRLSVSQTLSIGIEAAQALARAHEEGIVHRDIKPANLLFDVDGRLRIADFGLARALSESGFTDHGDRMVGTARYAAPEQARGVRVDGKVDVYALGLVLSECVTGTVPLVFDGPVDTLMVRQDTPVPVPAALGPMVPLLERMGRPDPAERPTAAEVTVALLAIAPKLPRPDPLPLAGVGLDSPVGPVGDDELTVLPGGDRTGYLPPVAVPDSDGRRGVRRRWLLAALAAVLVVFGGGAAVWAVTRPPTAEVPNVDDLTIDQAEARIAAVLRKAGDVAWTVRRQPADHETVLAGVVIDQEPRPGADLKDGGVVTLRVSSGRPPRPLPPLTNAREEEVEAILEQAGFVLKTPILRAYSEDIAKGLVTAWSVSGAPAPASARGGSAIEVTVSKGPEPRTVPNLKGKPVAEAKAVLEAAKLVVGLQKDVFSNEVSAGLVVGTEPASGPVDRGSTVVLVVSKGQDLVMVPNVRMARLDDALKALEANGLRLGTVFGDGSDRVVATSPAIGAKVLRGSEVDLTMR